MRFLQLGAALLGLLPLEGCGKNNPTTGSAPSVATTIPIDGTIDKWLKKTPAWDDGPAPAAQPSDFIHIDKVFFDNDANYLYVFIQCSPSVAERYKQTQMSGALADIFVDPENNPNTGSPAPAGLSEPSFRGYKFRIWVSIGVYVGTSSGSFISYNLYRFSGQRLDDNGGFNAEIPNTGQSSMHPGSLIAEGNDGVELAVPLQEIGLNPQAAARIMISADGNELGDPLQNYAFLRQTQPNATMPAVNSSLGFATYKCR